MKGRFFVILVLAAAIGAPWIVQKHCAAHLRKLDTNIGEQEKKIRLLSQETKRLLGLAGQPGPDLLSQAEVAELARLRNEARHLRDKLKEGEKMRRESGRIRQALQKNSQEDDFQNPTALLSEEMDIRQKRLDDLKKWLDENPQERIPELQYISDISWIRSADRRRITDEDFQGWMGAQRGNAEAKFARMAFEALKAYGAANGGRFPTALSQLVPFFPNPVDGAILERYQIVNSKTLPKFLAEGGGDWAITQKAPINPRFDSRLAISLKGRRATLEEGRWDSSTE